MPKTLHLHIGWPKCGSTTLQGVLSKNRGLLVKAGYYYPQIPGKGSRFANGKPLLRGDVTKGPTAKNLRGRFFQKHPDIVNIADRPAYFRQNYLNTDAENIVISAEGLYRGALRWDLTYVYDHFDAIKIYWVIRPQLLRVQSSYLQGVRSGNFKLELVDTIDEAEYQEKFDDNIKFEPTLKFWSAIAGPENVNIMLMSPQHPDIVEQFFEAMMGYLPKDLKIGKKRRVRAGAVTTAAVLSLHDSMKTENLQKLLKTIKIIRQQARELEITEKTVDVLVPEVYSRLSKRFMHDNEYFAQAQDKYSFDDICPDLTDMVASSTTLASVREWDDYHRLRDSLAKDGIRI